MPIEVDQQSCNFQKVLWEQQTQYNTLAKKKQMKWHPLMLRFALGLHFASKSCIFIYRNQWVSISSLRKNLTWLYTGVPLKMEFIYPKLFYYVA